VKIRIANYVPKITNNVFYVKKISINGEVNVIKVAELEVLT
jgi:hypothetical protein